MAWIQVDWRLKIRDPEEGDPGESPAKDEPSLQFAFVTHFGSEVRLHGYTTGNLFPHNYGTGGTDPRYPDKVGIVSSKNVPTTANPYFGIVVRAVEQDNSSDRAGDNNRFYDAVRDRAQTIFDAGGIPSATDLLTAGASAQLRDRLWRDDDDFIGVGAQVFPTYGVETIPLIPNDEGTLPDGQMIARTRRSFGFHMTARPSTHYIFGGDVQLVINDPLPPLRIGDRLIEPPE